MYGTKLANLWSVQNVSIANIKAVWEGELAKLTRRQVNAGIEACKRREWPPTLPEFLLLCNPPPDYQGLFELAVRQAHKRQYDADVWPNKAVYWAYVKMGGYEMRTQPWEKLRARWIALIDQNRAVEATLPDIPRAEVLALAAPGKSLTSKDVGRERMKEVLALARAACAKVPAAMLPVRHAPSGFFYQCEVGQ